MSKDWQSASAAYRSCRHEFLLIARVPRATLESSRTEKPVDSAALANRWSSQMKLLLGGRCSPGWQRHPLTQELANIWQNGFWTPFIRKWRSENRPYQERTHPSELFPMSARRGKAERAGA